MQRKGLSCLLEDPDNLGWNAGNLKVPMHSKRKLSKPADCNRIWQRSDVYGGVLALP